MELGRKIRRSRSDRVLAGVCGGVAHALGVDPTLVRIVAVVLAAFGGAGLVVYAAAALLLPGEDGGAPIVPHGGRGETVLALAALVLLVVLVVNAGGPLPGPPWLVAAAVAAGTVGWVVSRERRAAAPATPAPVPPPTPEQPTAVAPAPARRRRGVSWMALGAVVVMLAVAGGVLVAVPGGGTLRWELLAAAAVVVIGAALVASAPFGGAPALIPLGIAMAAVVGVIAAAGGTGSMRYEPASAAAVRPAYHLAAGTLRLDLGDVDLPPGETAVSLNVGIGDAIVTVPRGVRVEGFARVGLGDADVLGTERGGAGVERRLGAGSGASILRLGANVGVGQVVVRRADA